SAMSMCAVVGPGAFTTGGFNFDSKVRRQSMDPVDLFYGHVGGIDTVARGLLTAAALVEDGRLDAIKAERYAGWSGAFAGKLAGLDLAGIADLAEAEAIDPKPRS